MATRTNNDVTLSHSDAQKIAEILTDYARAKLDHAGRTRSAAVRAACTDEGIGARKMAQDIVAKLWTWKA